MIAKSKISGLVLRVLDDRFDFPTGDVILVEHLDGESNPFWIFEDLIEYIPTFGVDNDVFG